MSTPSREVSATMHMAAFKGTYVRMYIATSEDVRTYVLQYIQSCRVEHLGHGWRKHTGFECGM